VIRNRIVNAYRSVSRLPTRVPRAMHQRDRFGEDGIGPSWFRQGVPRWRERVRGPWLAALALLLVLPFLAGLLPIVRFVRERIDITLEPDEILVTGRYVYRNPWPFPVTQGLTVPLPVDADHPMPTELTVTRLTPTPVVLPVRTLLGQVIAEVPFGPNEEILVGVRYRQHAPTREGRYLLTTTRPWRRPLEDAMYTLRVEGVGLVGSNYALERIAPGSWAFERTQFMPPADWRFAWEVPDPSRTE